MADVLSHLGSGSELTLVRSAPAMAGEPSAEVDNQSVWDRWNAMSPEDQASGFLETTRRSWRPWSRSTPSSGES